MSVGEGRGTDVLTTRGRDWPSVRQFNVFLENRLGKLLEVVRRFETTDIRIVSLTMVDSADCAIIRLVLSDPERALEIFRLANLPITESDLLVVELPDGPQPLLKICKALLMAEISIHYAYPLLIGPHGHAAVAIHVDDHETAAQTLKAMASCSSRKTISTTDRLRNPDPSHRSGGLRRSPPQRGNFQGDQLLHHRGGPRPVCRCVGQETIDQHRQGERQGADVAPDVGRGLRGTAVQFLVQVPGG